MTDSKRKSARPTESLSAQERAKHYREAATEAFGHAETTRDIGLRAEYFDLAAGWHNLAFELERQAAPAKEPHGKTGRQKRSRT